MSEATFVVDQLDSDDNKQQSVKRKVEDKLVIDDQNDSDQDVEDIDVDEIEVPSGNPLVTQTKARLKEVFPHVDAEFVDDFFADKMDLKASEVGIAFDQCAEVILNKKAKPTRVNPPNPIAVVQTSPAVLVYYTYQLRQQREQAMSRWKAHMKQQQALSNTHPNHKPLRKASDTIAARKGDRAMTDGASKATRDKDESKEKVVKMDMIGYTKYTLNTKMNSEVDFDCPIERHIRYVESQMFRNATSDSIRGSVQRIAYVENPVLSRAYEAKKAELREKGIPDKELLLFHGTKDVNADSILRRNFDKDKCSPRGAYGTGFYFAGNPAKATQYGKVVIACKVLPGLQQSRTDGKVFQPERGYHSFHANNLNNTKKPEIYVVADKDHLLPYCVIQTNTVNYIDPRPLTGSAASTCKAKCLVCHAKVQLPNNSDSAKITCDDCKFVFARVYRGAIKPGFLICIRGDFKCYKLNLIKSCQACLVARATALGEIRMNDVPSTFKLNELKLKYEKANSNCPTSNVKNFRV